jgi:hypothetical protein
MDFKKCPVCKIVKTRTDFYKDKSRKDGLLYRCKVCDKKKYGLWQKSNKDKIKEQRKRYIAKKDIEYSAVGGYQSYVYQKNKESYKKYQRDYYRRNKGRKEKGNIRTQSHFISLDKFCGICGYQNLLVRHHFSYTDKNAFITVCRECHYSLHKILRDRGLSIPF